MGLEVEEEKQHRALAIVPTIMRLSVLALFIALPAAAYAAVCTQQRPLDSEGDCIPNEDTCSPDGPPCCVSTSTCTAVRTPYGGIYVCHIAHLLLFTLSIELNAGMPLSRPTRYNLRAHGRDEECMATIMPGPCAFKSRTCTYGLTFLNSDKLF